MKSKLIRILRNISKDLHTFLAEHNNMCVNRNRKNNIYDVVAYKLYYTQQLMTQEKAIIKLNKFKKSNKSSRQSIVKKEKKLDASFYEELSLHLSKSIAKYMNAEYNDYTNTKYTKQIIAVDGSYPTLLESLEKDGFKTNKNRESVTPLINGLFNVTYNYPIIMDLVKTKDERKAFANYIKNKNCFKNNIFVFDRGYGDKKLFKYLSENNMFYICRLKENSKLISNKNDKIITTDDGMKIRIIKYTIDNKSYYLASNLLDYKVQYFKSIYHDRWQIEEYFKYIKKNTNLSKMEEKKEENVRKTILAQLIVSQIAYLFANCCKQNNNSENKIINKSILTYGLYDNFLYNFLNDAKFTKYFILEFIKTYVQIIISNKGKSNPRTCKRSNYNWYFKKYQKNVKSKN